MWRRSLRIANLIPMFWALLPELGLALVDHIGPEQAIKLIYWCVAAAIVLLSVVIGEVTCLLVKKLKCWLHCSPERA